MTCDYSRSTNEPSFLSNLQQCTVCFMLRVLLHEGFKQHEVQRVKHLQTAAGETFRRSVSD